MNYEEGYRAGVLHAIELLKKSIEVEKPVEVEKPKLPPKPPAPPKASISFEQLQELLFEQYTRLGNNRQIMDDVVTSFNVKDTSELSPSQYPELLAKVRAL